MDMATVFDTLAFSRRLQSAHFTPEQSDALADAVHDAVRGSVATKSDLDLAVEKLNGKIGTLNWMMGFTFAGVAALVLKSFF